MFEYRARVVRWIDADTLVADIDLGFRAWVHNVHLRLLGVQAPDRQPAKAAATAYVRARWPDGSDLVVQTVRDSADREVTTFERWMAVAYDPHTETPIGELLVHAGHAVPWDGTGTRPDV